MQSLFRISAVALILLAPRAMAQEEAEIPPCAAPEFRQLDFWVGTWNLTWTTQDGQSAKGKNIISRVLDDCVIEERFSTSFGKRPFKGVSVSTYDAKAKMWRQTWVSNAAGYLLFEGGPSPEGFQLRLVNPPDDRSLRMIWTNVKDNSLDWHWQMSMDGGKTWEDIGVKHYTRAD